MTFLENFFTQFTGILIVSRLPGEIGELSFSWNTLTLSDLHQFLSVIVVLNLKGFSVSITSQLFYNSGTLSWKIPNLNISYYGLLKIC